ncbi:MAG: SAM-dependent methyltransferase [Christensenellales bacterium]
MSGVVYIGENKVDKASAQVTPEDELIVRQTGTGYVSRGALKLEKGFAVFGVEAKDRVAMDLGASTGGFTDVLPAKRRGACVRHRCGIRPAGLEIAQ